MKKLLCLVLACIMIFSMVGCGKGNSEGTAANGEGAGRVKIEFWYGLGGHMGEVVESIIKEFNESQEEVTVVGVPQASYDETKKLLQAAIASGKVPATVMLNYQTLRPFAERGIMACMDPLIAADPDFHQEDIIQSLLSYCQIDDGKVYGLPVYGTTQVMYYRMDTFEKAGIDPDEAFKNWQNLAEAAEKMAIQENGETTFFGWMPMYGEGNMKDIAFSNGAEVLSEDGTKVLLNTPEWVEPWEAIRKWIHDDKIMGIHFGGDGWEYWYKTIDDVMQGRAAGYIGSNGDQGDLDFNIVAAHVQPGFNDHDSCPIADPITCGIPEKASQEQKEAGFKWLSYLTGTHGTAKFGMETGYIPVRKSVTEDAEFKAYLDTHPQALVAMQQAEIGHMNFIDPTGGKIDQIIKDTVDLIEIENVPAQEALDKATKLAQEALDEVLAK